MEHRQGAANDSFGQEVNPVLADIHLRVLRVLRFHLPCLLPAQPFQFVDASRRSRSPVVFKAAFVAASSKDVDGRDKPGHDDEGTVLHPYVSAYGPPPTSVEVDPGINLVKREVDAKLRQANWSGRVRSFPVPRLLTRFAPERTE